LRDYFLVSTSIYCFIDKQAFAGEVNESKGGLSLQKKNEKIDPSRLLKAFFSTVPIKSIA
jgi:hypothetical protein